MKEKYIQFRLNKLRIAFAVLAAAACIVMDVLMPEDMLKFSLAMCAMFAFGGLCDVKLRFRGAEVIWLAAAAASALACVVFVQLVNECSPMLPMNKLLLGAEAALIVMLILCNVFIWLLPNGGRAMKSGIILGAVMLLCLGIINFYTANTRGKGISPIDFRAIGTAMSVAGNYEYAVTTRMWQAIVFFVAMVFIMSGINTVSPGKRYMRAAALLPLTAAVLLHMNSALSSVTAAHWQNDGCINNGLVLNLFAQLKEEHIPKPDGYSQSKIQLLEEEYASAGTAGDTKQPNIIVVMNEAFSDMRVWGAFETNVPVMPFMDSLNENVVKGSALVSIIGGGTPNSEYEFITGNSLFFLSPSSMPFQQYIYDPVYCLERYLEGMGYDSYFTHPCHKTNWSRHTAYPLLGFNEIYFDEIYDAIDDNSPYASDEYVYEKLIEEYEQSIGDKQFIFAVTMQNHSPYFVTGHEEPVQLLENGTEEINEYLSRVRDSDTALKGLIEYFEQREEPVVVMMYGDHQPKITEQFKAAIGAESRYDFGVDMTQYIVPFVIWANYDIEEKNVELTSLNFLSGYLLEAAGIELSPYNMFLRDVEQVVPAMNGFGYWSNAKGDFASYNEAQGEEKEWLQRYEMLQYNAIFDKKGRSEVFFPNK